MTKLEKLLNAILELRLDEELAMCVSEGGELDTAEFDSRIAQLRVDLNAEITSYVNSIDRSE